MQQIQIRTDLALEATENMRKDTAGEMRGVVLEEYDCMEDVHVTRVMITSKNAAKSVGKPVGTYVTFEAPQLQGYDEDYHRSISEELAKALRSVLPGIEEEKSVLIVGLGNRDVTADALGPETVDNLFITRHIINEYGKQAYRAEKMHRISSLVPGVMAKTGMETAEIVKYSISADENIPNGLKGAFKVLVLVQDLSVMDAADQIWEKTEAEGCVVEVLVNNAGITKDGLMMRMDEAQWDAVIDTNLKSAFNYIHACTPVMARQRSGSIINMSSVVGISGNAGQCNYAASKAGLIGLSKSISKEMGARGVRSNCIAPGFIATDMTGNQTENPLLQRIPLGRMGEAEEVAEAVAYLAAAKYVTGEVLRVDGGIAI